MDMPGEEWWRVPEQEYSPIRQQAVLLKRASDSMVGSAFIEFLKSDQAVSVLVDRYGYGIESN